MLEKWVQSSELSRELNDIHNDHFANPVIHIVQYVFIHDVQRLYDPWHNMGSTYCVIHVIIICNYTNATLGAI